MFSSKRVTRIQQRRSAMRNSYIDVRWWIFVMALHFSSVEAGPKLYCLNPFYVVPQCRVRSLSVDGCLLLFVSSFRATRTYGKLTLTGGSTRLVATRSRIPRFRSFLAYSCECADSVGQDHHMHNSCRHHKPRVPHLPQTTKGGTT